MPELPEVEHVVRALRRAIVGRCIVDAELKLKRIAPKISRSSFCRRLRGTRIESVSRRGKHILIRLDTTLVLLAHLRMTGKFVSLSADQPLPAYSHVIFHLDNTRRLVFCDMRQFGRMRLLPASFVERSPELRSLAPEPLSDAFSIDYFYSTVGRSRRSLKQLLLDQTKILGLGNIYAAEALFLARINPFRKGASVSRQRLVNLHGAIKSILQEAIDSGSTLRIDLHDGEASYFGRTERFWQVYDREGFPCTRCGRLIRRVIRAGRSTYFCPQCQRR